MGPQLSAAPLLTSWTAALAAAVLVAAPVRAASAQPAPAQPGPAQPAGPEPTAKERVARGLEYYEAGNYDKAIAEFQRAHEASGSTAILFPWAQAERLRGNCREAIDLYQRFINSGPPPKQVEAATKNRQDCEARLQSTDAVAASLVPGDAGDVIAADPPPDPPEPEPEAEPEPPPPPPPPRWRSDAAGWTLVALGASAAIAGGVVLGLAARNESSATDAPTYGEFADFKTAAAHERIAGGVVLGVGAALLLGGVIRLAVSGRARDGQQARIQPRGLGIGGHF